MTSIVIQASVTSIGDAVFHNCSSLTSVVMSAGVTSIGDGAFSDCTSLAFAYFSGDVPYLGPDVFANCADGFTVYFLKERSGFSTPEWNGYPAVEIDEATDPSAPWLLGHGMYPDTPLGEDTNHDGVDLLMAWALNLNPNRNLAGSLPSADLSASGLSISFYAANPNVLYTVETSTNLSDWTTEGVTYEGPPERLAATVSLDGGRRFLRLVVDEK